MNVNQKNEFNERNCSLWLLHHYLSRLSDLGSKQTNETNRKSESGEQTNESLHVFSIYGFATPDCYKGKIREEIDEISNKTYSNEN